MYSIINIATFLSRRLLAVVLCCLCSLAVTADNDKAELRRLRQQVDELQARLSASDRQRTADSLAIDSLTLALQRLQAFRDEFVRQQLVGQCPDLRQPFSAISPDSLQRYANRLHRFEGDPEADHLLSRVALFSCYQQLADTLRQPLSVPFDREAVVAASHRITQQLKPLVGIELTEAQYAEFDTIDIYLTRYYQGVLDFQKLIADVDAQTKSYKGSNDPDNRDFCQAKYQRIVTERQADIERRISHIPYLAERFAVYDAAMQDNPLQLSDEALRAIDEIKDLKTR